MKKSDPVEIDYKSLGTIAIDELKQAIWEDIEALKDQFGVSYVTGVKLVVPATNEFGDPVVVKRLATGATVKRLERFFTWITSSPRAATKSSVRSVGALASQLGQTSFSLPSTSSATSSSKLPSHF